MSTVLSTACIRADNNKVLAVNSTSSYKYNSQQVFPDNFMRREILSLIAQCIYVESGCKWKGEVKHLEVWCLFYSFSYMRPRG